MFTMEDLKKHRETKGEKIRKYPSAAKTFRENLADQLLNIMERQCVDFDKYYIEIKDNVICDETPCQTHFEYILPSLKRIQDWLYQACTEFATQRALTIETNIFAFDFTTAGKLLTIYADICLALAIEYDIPSEEHTKGHVNSEHIDQIWKIEQQFISRSQKQKEYNEFWKHLELFYRIRFPATLNAFIANHEQFNDPFVHPFRGTQPYYVSVYYEKNSHLSSDEGRLGKPDDFPNIFSFNSRKV